MKKIYTISIILTFILFFPLLIFAQNNIKGVVSDSLTNDPLIGANIILLGTAMGSASNFEGEYSIPNVPVGTYTLKVSYIGYRPKEYQVNVTGQDVSLDIFLIPDIIEGEEVLITAQALGQVSAINQQRSSNTIINVVSEEKIKELPDANAAESIGRLPGISILRSGGEANKVILRGLEDKFTNITIDGIKIPPTDATGRGVDLSMISQSSLSGIEVYKALTPDKDGDALAGSINLVTKGAPETRQIWANLKGGYNNLMDSYEQYDFSLHYGERFLDNFLGVQVNGNIENRIRSNERINVEYANQNRPIEHISNFLLEFTDEIRKRDGLSLLLDLKTPDEGTIRISNVFSRTKRDFLWYARDYPYNDGGDQGRPNYSFRDREQEIKTFNSSITGDNNFVGLSLEWGLSFGQSDSHYPFDYELIFAETNGMINPPEIREKPDTLINFAANNFSSARLEWAYYRGQDNLDKEKTAFLNLKKPYVIGNLFSGEIKIGGKYKIKDRSNSRNETFTPYYLGWWQSHELLPDGTIRPKDFSGSYFEQWRSRNSRFIDATQFFITADSRNVYDSYELTPLIDRDRLRQWYELNKYGVDSTGNQYEIWENPLIKYDDYLVTEKVAAGYIMNTLNIGQSLTFIAGLRIEDENNEYKATYMTDVAQGFPPPTNVLRDTTSSAKQTVLLPNFHISFRPFEFMNLRIAVYKALARPDFNMRLDRYNAGRPAQLGSNAQVFVGNPSLKTAQAWNFEINTSFYGNEIGLVSLSAYYKEIKDMYHMLNNFITVGDSIMQRFGIKWHNGFQPGVAYFLTLPYNSPEPAKVWGFEFEHQINFHFLPGLLKNIVLSYNASIVRSEAILFELETVSILDTSGPIPIRRDRNILAQNKHKLEGMPEFFGNISLGYDIGGFSGRVSVFHQSAYDSSYSARGFGDAVINPFTRIDLSLKQKFTDYLSVFLNLNNLTNVEDGQSTNNRVYSRKQFGRSEKYGLTADLGVRVEL